MCIIHGDKHKKNAILSDNGELTFIDWELGCIGDIAYDVAFHLHQMAYTESDEGYFLDRLKSNYLVKLLENEIPTEDGRILDKSKKEICKQRK